MQINFREQKISEVGLSIRTVKCLERAGISTLGELVDLIDYTPEYFLQIRNLGYNKQLEILDLLREHRVDLYGHFQNDSAKRRLTPLDEGRNAPYPENLLRKIGLPRIFGCYTYTPLDEDQLRFLENEIGKLFDKDQEFINKRFKQGLTTAESAIECKLSEGEIWWILSKLGDKLKVKFRKEQDIRAKDIRAANFTMRTFNLLWKNNITTIGKVLDLLEDDPEAFLKIKGFGQLCQQEVIEKLRKFGYEAPQNAERTEPDEAVTYNELDLKIDLNSVERYRRIVNAANWLEANSKNVLDVNIMHIPNTFVAMEIRRSVALSGKELRVFNDLTALAFAVYLNGSKNGTIRIIFDVESPSTDIDP